MKDRQKGWKEERENEALSKSITFLLLQLLTDVCVCVYVCTCVCVVNPSQGLLTDDLLKEKVAECTGFNGKGVTLAGFDELVDKLV